MKIFLFSIGILFTCLQGYSQSCDQMLADAAKAERAGEFRDAIQKYNAAARRCGPSKATEIDAKVLGVFDKIEALKQRAERAQADLTVALNEVKKQKSAKIFYNSSIIFSILYGLFLRLA